MAGGLKPMCPLMAVRFDFSRDLLRGNQGENAYLIQIAAPHAILPIGVMGRCRGPAFSRCEPARQKHGFDRRTRLIASGGGGGAATRMRAIPHQ
jgi:hypothetical protein